MNSQLPKSAPFFTIVIPTFNREAELRRSIGSVLKQECLDWELLVIDDGSTDATENLLIEFKKKDDRIKYIKRPMSRIKGATSCKNLGAELAKGQFIAFLDSDDEWNESKLQNDHEFILANNDIKALYSGVLINNGKQSYKAKTRHIRQGEGYEDLVFSGENFAQASVLVVKKEVFKRVQFDEHIFQHEDMDFFIKIGNKYGWAYSDQFLTTVHWEGVKSISDFESMIIFYERHKPHVVYADNLARYLTWAWVSAARFRPEFKSYYAEELKTLPNDIKMKYRVFIPLREPIFKLWKIIFRK